MPTTRVYRSTDGSAPVLSGTAGALVTVLDAILVNGYGAQTAAGWTKAFSGTNKAAYRQGNGNQFYLRIRDDSPGAGAAKQAWAVGYETMSDVDTGTKPFPSVSQSTNGLFPRKSTTADATARAWVCLADDRTFYFFALTGDAANTYLAFMYGDVFSLQTGDPYRTMLLCHNTDNDGGAGSEPLTRLAITSTGAVSGCFAARAHSGFGSAINAGIHGDRIKGADNGSIGQLFGNIAFTNPADAGIYISRIWVHETTGPVLRGYLRGFWQFLHGVGAVADGDTMTGSGSLAGRTFLFLKSASNSGVFLLETTNWDTSA